MMHRRYRIQTLVVLFLSLILLACASSREPGSGDKSPGQGAETNPETDRSGKPALVVYSGRSESLVGPLIERYERATGQELLVRWGNTAELAATLLEEGDNSPADIFYAQDPGGMGAVASLLAPLPDDILEQVDPRFRDNAGLWVGISGRARVVVYNTVAIQEPDLPTDLWGFTDPSWANRLGWAPANTSFQTMVTAMRVVWGEETTRQWLEGIIANQPVVYDNNTSIVAAVGAGEVDAGFVNHYYLFRFLREEGQDFPARNHFLSDGGPGSLVMVSSAGVLASSENQPAAYQLIRYLLSEESQAYFAEQTYEYPLIPGIPIDPGLIPLAQLNAAEIPLTDLADLKSTVSMLRAVGALP